MRVFSNKTKEELITKYQNNSVFYALVETLCAVNISEQDVFDALEVVRIKRRDLETQERVEGEK